MNLRQVFLVGVAALAFAGSARAQTTTGTIRGYVKDQNGTAVAGADVQAMIERLYRAPADVVARAQAIATAN